MLTQEMVIDEEIQLSTEIRELISLIGGLTEAQLTTFLRFLCVRHCNAGERIFLEGDLPSNIYILTCGRVDLVVEKNGVPAIQNVFKPGDTFGETAVIGIQNQLGTAIASGDDVELLVLSREALINILETDIELYGILMMNIARDVSRKLHVNALS